MKREVWITDSSNKKVKIIKQSFQENLAEQAKQMRINYYDFLLVAKKLSFRFEESSHLMALKNFFSKNKNSVVIKKLVDTLAINQESLNSHDQKIIVKFNVPFNDFAPIKEVTCEDEEENYIEEEEQEGEDFAQIGHPFDEDQQINEKMTIILSIKMEEMQKKIKLLTNQFHYPNLFTVFDDHPTVEIEYESFKEKVLLIVADIRDKIKISQDDIKTMFHILEEEGKPGKITLQHIQKFKNLEEITQKMKNFYLARINREMVKNTLFKLGKVKNSSIQIYQLKNASVLEFQKIQDQIVNEPIPRIQPKKRIPHFGPLKGNTIRKNHDKHYNSSDIKSTQVHLTNGRKQIDKQRQKIQKILRHSKQDKKKDKHGDTVASKLRSLFIHKVILPREKMLEQQKIKYGRIKMNEHQLAIKPMKQTR